MSNPTVVKEIAVYFFDKIGVNPTPSIFAKTISQVKTTFKDGYCREDILATIDYIIDVKRINLYSYGYVNMAISSLLKDSTRYYESLLADKAVLGAVFETNREEVGEDETTERNRKKTGDNSPQSRFGKKFNFDMSSET